MPRIRKSIQTALSLIIIISLTILPVRPAPAGASAAAQGKGGLQMHYNVNTGKVNFITTENGLPLSASKALGFEPETLTVEPAITYVNHFGPEFGVKSPSTDLNLIRTSQSEDGRKTTHFQQYYQDIPVMAGELIVNTNEQGDLYSINGEVSTGLSLSTKPKITSDEARQTALQSMSKWYQAAPADFTATEPELWIYDPSLMGPGDGPVSLVWRMEVSANEVSDPVNELVLVDAQRGGIALHFNQIDTSFSASRIQSVSAAPIFQGPTWPVYFELALDETRGWIYGSDSAGNKVDVIDMTTRTLVKSFTLVNGAAPKGIALSPDGSELAVAQNGASSILFLDPDSGSVVASITPAGTIGGNVPWDVVYGRTGRLYSSGSPESGGIDYIHVMDTTTHTEVSRSSDSIRSAPRLAISADNNWLYANQANFSPQKLYKFAVSTDTLPSATTTPHTSGFTGATYILDSTNDIIFTSTGQVWKSDLTAKIGSTGVNGERAYLPGHNAVAIAAPSSVVFTSAKDFYPISTYALSGTVGPLAALSDGSKLFVSTSNGIVVIGLSSFPPGSPSAPPTGSLPYADLILDEANDVLYGSNMNGHKVDVISPTTLQVIDEIRFVNGASPMGMDISPDGAELAVALYGASSVAFIDTSSRLIIDEAIVDNLDLNVPSDVIYGRPGRLYSRGNPGSGGLDYLHIFDTSTHSEIGKSTYPDVLRSGNMLAISSNNNSVFANEQFSPNKLYKFDASTDTLPSPTTTGHSSGFSASTFLLLADDSKIFTSNGQVWSNPASLASSAQIGSFGATGQLVELPSLDQVVVINNSGAVNFISSVDYYISSTLTLPSVSSVGPSAASSDDKKVYINTNNGVTLVTLEPTLPSSAPVISGSNQSTVAGAPFAQPLVVKVQNYLSQPLSGITVTFTAPTSGPSGTFSGGGTFTPTAGSTATAVSGADGLATSPVFTSNDQTGSYSVIASIAGLPDTTSFFLNNLDGAADILTYDANNLTLLPGTLLCDSTVLVCTGGADLDADSAHTYARGTIQLYYDKHARMSFDDLGSTVVSSVHFWVNYDNAFWDGTQMVYGDYYGFARADDVIAHELTHGVTQHESNLFYYYQSGAINESFSDVWGEYYDQTNSLGNDSAGVRWLMGEDITGMGEIRSMSNPPAYGDPDRMTSSLYATSAADQGGVHTNSGVNNKAVYLMVNGGSFNGRTITPIGWDKTAAVYYEAATKLLTSGSDYSDLYYGLNQACVNLTGGTLGITPTDCLQVQNAALAVEMNLQPRTNFNPDAPVCGPMQPPTDAIYENFEGALSNWTFTNGTYPRWQLDSSYFGPYAHSGLHSLYADDDPDVVTDATARLASLVIPAGAYLHFTHAFDFDQWAGIYYDGGVLEYSTNGGSTWQDATALIDNNGYTGTITSGFGNPLSGRRAFVGTSHGYISTRLNLSSLAGQTVTFRWRLGLDDSIYAMGWWVDDVRIYTCVAPTFSDVPFNYSVVLGGITYYLHDYIETLYDAGYTAGCATGPLRYCPNNTMNRAESAVFMLRGEFGSGYVPPPAPWGSFADDWSPGLWAEKWAEGMLDAGMTAGCQLSPLKFCPWDQLPRVQAAVFGLRMKYGMAHNPPLATGLVFADMTDTSYWGTKWAEQAYNDGLIPACGFSGGKPQFCPNTLFTRAWGAYLIVKAKNLPLTP